MASSLTNNGLKGAMMLRTGTPVGPPREGLTVFIVSYGQHRIGIARASDGDQAAYLIAGCFSGEIEHEKLKVREASPDEKEVYGKLLEAGDEMVVGVLL
jgi:hypothetical protein